MRDFKFAFLQNASLSFSKRAKAPSPNRKSRIANP
jgi:hypothetical protein